MKKHLLFLFIITTLNASADHWTQKASVGTRHLSYPTSFSIGNKGYVCGGRDSLSHFSKALWEYDQLTDSWSQKADYGGAKVTATSAFVLLGNGYVGLGADSTDTKYKDLWEYNPLLNNHIQ